MQASVDAILAAANETGEFELVQDGAFKSNEKYPALITTDRRGKLASQDTRNRLYDVPAEITAFVFVRKKEGYAELERITKAWLKKLIETDSRFQLADLDMWEPERAPSGGYEVIICYVLLRHLTSFDLT